MSARGGAPLLLSGLPSGFAGALTPAPCVVPPADPGRSRAPPPPGARGAGCGVCRRALAAFRQRGPRVVRSWLIRLGRLPPRSAASRRCASRAGFCPRAGVTGQGRVAGSPGSQRVGDAPGGPTLRARSGAGLSFRAPCARVRPSRARRRLRAPSARTEGEGVKKRCTAVQRRNQSTYTGLPQTQTRMRPF